MPRTAPRPAALTATLPPATLPPVLCIVGAGPTAIGVLERLVANAAELSAGLRPQVHLVDPHPPGGGRVWRAQQPSLLWANSLVADVTVLPDASVQVEGPVGGGTTLWQWIRDVAAALPADDPIGVQARRLSPTSFPSRPLMNAYLSWVLAQVVEAARPWADVHLHATRAVDARVNADGVEVQLADGGAVDADLVLLAQGHLDARPNAAERATGRRAAAAGLTYVPTGYTADLDLTVLAPGQDVLVRGAGLAFIDLMVLLTSGRGGTFERAADGRLRYLASGEEPVLHVGSRRGVPYRSKLGYVWPGPPVPARFFTPDAVAAAFGTERQLDLRADLEPLVARELAWAAYTELFRAHPERTTVPWPEFSERWAATADPEARAALEEAAVPSPADRFDLSRLDRPLTGARFGDSEELQEWVRAYVRDNLARAGDPAHSADAAVFTALLGCFGTIAGLMSTGRLTPRSESEDLPGWWMNLFSYLASGPPGPRLEELIALSEAGVVRFLGADVQIELDEEARVFRARSTSTDAVTQTKALIEARLPEPDIASTTDRLVTALVTRGGATEKLLAAPPHGHLGTGRLHVDAAARVVTATGEAQERLFAVGHWTSGGQVAAFARPGTNGPFFRQNDALARRLWQGLTDARVAPAARAQAVGAA